MGKAVQMFCSGDWDHKRVPQGTENLDSLLDAAPSHLPTRPQRCFTGENPSLITPLHALIADISTHKLRDLWPCLST